MCVYMCTYGWVCVLVGGRNSKKYPLSRSYSLYFLDRSQNVSFTEYMHSLVKVADFSSVSVEDCLVSVWETRN